MFDITKTRMLLTTAVFAAVAALFAAGANARIPEDSGSASAAQESLRIGLYAAQAPSWRGKGGKGEETEGFRGQAFIGTGVGGAQAPSWRGKGGKGEETEGFREQASTGTGVGGAQAPSWQGTGGKGEE